MPCSTCKYRQNEICWNQGSGWFLEEMIDDFECWEFEKKGE